MPILAIRDEVQSINEVQDEQWSALENLDSRLQDLEDSSTVNDQHVKILRIETKALLDRVAALEQENSELKHELRCVREQQRVDQRFSNTQAYKLHTSQSQVERRLEAVEKSIEMLSQKRKNLSLHD